jgi:sulfide:quinone oxidoreductase
MHDFLTERGLRDRCEIALVMPLPVPIPPSPDASKAILEAFAERDIEWHPSHVVSELDPLRKVARFDDGTEMPFDLFLGVPVHRVPEVVAESGMCVDGWIPVDPGSLATAWPGVYAVGDVTSVGTPKAGVFAEGQAAVVAGEIIALARGGSAAGYDGRGVCYLEFGGEGVAVVDVTFVAGQAPFGFLNGPSTELIAEKSAFGTTRIKRWFGRDW